MSAAQPLQAIGPCISQAAYEVGPEFEGPTKTPPGEIVAQVEDGEVTLRVPSSFANALSENVSSMRLSMRSLVPATRRQKYFRTGWPKPNVAAIALI